MLYIGGKQRWESSREKAATEAAVVEAAVVETGVSEEISALGRCIKQLVLSAGRNVKFHSSQQKASQFIAGTAIEKERISDSS